ncbi:putative mitochondrial carrier protein, partial [Operophtera brumata]
VYSIVGVTTQFFVYEMSTKYIAKSLITDNQNGIFAGCCSAALVIPLEVIRVRQMLLKNQYKGLFNGAREVYIPKCENGSCSQTDDSAQKPQHVAMASMIAGTLAGFVSKTATYPLDLAKRRMQIGSHHSDSRFKVPSTSKNLIKCTRLYTCFSQACKKEGFIGLYRGWRVTICKAQLTSLVAFTTYELMGYVFREIINK